MKNLVSILISFALVSCIPEPDQKNNNFSHEIYESKTDITISIDKDKFQIDARILRKPGTRKLRYVRKVIISNHSNKIFLVGSRFPEYKIVSSYEIKSYSTAAKECFNELITKAI